MELKKVMTSNKTTFQAESTPGIGSFYEVYFSDYS